MGLSCGGSLRRVTLVRDRGVVVAVHVAQVSQYVQQFFRCFAVKVKVKIHSVTLLL